MAKGVSSCIFDVLIVHLLQGALEVHEDTYLTTDEMSARIEYDARTIRERLKDSLLIEGVHYIRPFGGRKLLYLWESIARDIAAMSSVVSNATRRDGSAIDRLLATRFSSGAVRGKGASEDGVPPPSQPPPVRRAMPVALA